VSPVDHQKVESLFDATDKDRQALIQTIGDSARVRAECSTASDGIGRDFTRDFSPADHPFRRPARSLVIKSNNIAARLQAQLTSLENAAWDGIRAANQGAIERDTTIACLIREVASCDETLREEHERMRQEVGAIVAHAVDERAALETALCVEIVNAEEELGPLREHLAKTEKRLRYIEAHVRDATTAAAEAEEERRLLHREMTQMKRTHEAELSKAQQAIKGLKAEVQSAKRETREVTAEKDKAVMELAKLKTHMAELTGDEGSAATRLRAAEAEGGNLRALATAACDKLEALEEVAGQLRNDLSKANRCELLPIASESFWLA